MSTARFSNILRISYMSGSCHLVILKKDGATFHTPNRTLEEIKRFLMTRLPQPKFGLPHLRT
jgi:hypothetical protein